MSSDKHSGSCLGYICTCDELVKTLRAENARYREALEFYANDSWDLGCGCCQDIHSEVFIKRSEVADKALKGEL